MANVYSLVSEVWEAQLADIAQARHSVLFEQYIVEDLWGNGIGRRFLEALADKAREGVEVWCILDAQGCFELFRSQELHDWLTDAGVKIFYYKTLGVSKLISPARLFLRDHRKLLLIDHDITWIGGVVVGERFRDWHDLMVRFTEPAISDIANKEFRNQLLRLADKTVLLAPMQVINEKYHLSGNAPGFGNRFCYEEICHAIMLATKSVTLVTPYFAPPWKLTRVIERRLAEGLSIELLVPRKSDVWLADAAREGYIHELLQKGLTVRYFDSMLHAKVVMVDDEWITFGSTNLDALSLNFNHELNIVSRDRELISKIKDVVADWCHDLTPVTVATCEYHNISPVRRFLGKLARYLA
ncbi:MAG TPA: phospholipase D-like domain-containing protein [Candidatus Paceibacterota bacterium]|jgi:cardiolipin synthase